MLETIICGGPDEPGAMQLPDAIRVPCEDCEAMVVIRASCPIDYPTVCVDCVSQRALNADLKVVMPSGALHVFLRSKM